MKKILIPIIALLLLVACNNGNRVENSLDIDSMTDTIMHDDSLRYDGKSVIDFMCDEFAYDELTPEEIARWDSMNANGGGQFMRGAERYLDTIVKHIHLILLPEA